MLHIILRFFFIATLLLNQSLSSTEAGHVHAASSGKQGTLAVGYVSSYSEDLAKVLGLLDALKRPEDMSSIFEIMKNYISLPVTSGSKQVCGLADGELFLALSEAIKEKNIERLLNHINSFVIADCLHNKGLRPAVVGLALIGLKISHLRPFCVQQLQAFLNKARENLQSLKDSGASTGKRRQPHEAVRVLERSIALVGGEIFDCNRCAPSCMELDMRNPALIAAFQKAVDAAASRPQFAAPVGKGGVEACSLGAHQALPTVDSLLDGADDFLDQFGSDMSNLFSDAAVGDATQDDGGAIWGDFDFNLETLVADVSSSDNFSMRGLSAEKAKEVQALADGDEGSEPNPKRQCPGSRA